MTHTKQPTRSLKQKRKDITQSIHKRWRKEWNKEFKHLRLSMTFEEILEQRCGIIL